MKAKFIGDPNDGGSGPAVLNLFGRAFLKDRWMTITGEDAESVISRLSTNGHFVVEEGDGEDPVIASASAFDHDGDKKVGGSRRKKDVIADLDALASRHPGKIAYDPSKTSNELDAVLENLKFELGED